MICCTFCFCLNDTATTDIYTYGHTLSLHDALPILETFVSHVLLGIEERVIGERRREFHREIELAIGRPAARLAGAGDRAVGPEPNRRPQDRKSTRLNSSH